MNQNSPATAGSERAFIPALKGQFKRPEPLPAGPSEQPAAGQRRSRRVPDYKVVEQPDVDKLQCRLQAPRDPLVGLAGLGDARRVIVCQDHGGRVYRQRLLDDLTRVDAGPVYRAAEHLVKPKHTMPVVEIKAAEQLVVQVTHPGQQEALGIRGAADLLSGRERFLKVTSGQLRERAQDLEPREADAVLLGSVGGPQWDDRPAEQRPELGLLQIRAALNLFCNLRPVVMHPALQRFSPLKPERLVDVDLMIVRELTSGSYFCKKWRDDDQAEDVCRYTKPEIERVTRAAGNPSPSAKGRPPTAARVRSMAARGSR